MESSEAAFVVSGGEPYAEEGTETLQAPRLSEPDRRLVLCRASAPAPRPTVCHQAWLRQQVAVRQQGVPPQKPAVREVSCRG